MNQEPIDGLERRIEEAFGELTRPNTEPRRIVAEKLGELARSGRAFSTEDLWQELRADHGRIGRATVFRSVEQLVEKGVLDRVELSDGSRKYRVCGGSHHHHLVCTSCDRIVDFKECLPESTLRRIGLQYDFVVKSHELTVYGTCRECTGDRLKSGQSTDTASHD